MGIERGQFRSDDAEFFGHSNLTNRDVVLGPVHTALASASGAKKAPIKARDDGQTARLAKE